MTCRSTLKRWPRIISALLAAVCLATPLAKACGPFFPSDILSKTDDELKAGPRGDFAVELERLKPHCTATVTAIIPEDKQRISYYLPDVASYGPAQTTAGDLADLRAALRESGASEAAITKMSGQLETLRKAIQTYQESLLKWEERSWDTTRGPKPEFSIVDIGNRLEGLPAEFADYQRGAIAYHSGQVDEARKSWLAILAQPAGQRKYRSTWAAYMIGRTYSTADPTKAVEYFRMTRELAKSGFADTLGLAAASLGWEAAAELKRDHPEQALALYLDQAASGDLTAGASLGQVASGCLADKKAPLNRLAKDEISRRVITAWLISTDYYKRSDTLANEYVHNTPRWLKAIEGADVKDAAGFDRLAWMAYKAGDFAATRRFLDRAPKDTGITYWVRAKLALREGKLEDAARFLDQAAKQFPETEEWPAATESKDADPPMHPRNRIRGELAVLKLSRSQYSTALDLLLKAGYWDDAAYVAERVLTPNELKSFVDQHVGSYKKQTHKAEDDRIITDSDPEPAIRHLLGRRLLRLGRWKEARAYFPAELQPKVDAYVTAIRTGHDAKHPNAERAKALWAAAKLARFSGLELLATELEPDGASAGGNWSSGKIESGPQRDKVVNVVSADERKRAEVVEVPNLRWHYRYTALDHAWAAAQLMPDDTDELAQLLCEAGAFVKAQDPKAADRFYKALVNRCPSTVLGQDAATRHWFPPDKPDVKK